MRAAPVFAVRDLPELRAEVRRRFDAGDPVGLLSERVEDKPWGVREFGLRDLDNNHLRFG